MPATDAGIATSVNELHVQNRVPDDARTGRMASSKMPGRRSLGGLLLRASGLLARDIAGETVSLVLTALLFAFLLGPVAALLLAGIWASAAFIQAFWGIWNVFASWDLADVFGRLGTLDAASRAALASGGFFALIFALVPVMAGALGRSWRRLYLLAGPFLAAPSAILLYVGAHLSLASLVAHLGIAPQVEPILVGYLFLDALLVAVLITDLRSVSPNERASHRRWRRGSQSTAGTAVQSPVVPRFVRYGPSTSGSGHTGVFADLVEVEPEVDEAMTRPIPVDSLRADLARYKHPRTASAADPSVDVTAAAASLPQTPPPAAPARVPEEAAD
jgi:hypothetical protein